MKKHTITEIDKKVEKEFWIKKFEEVKNDKIVVKFETIEELDNYLEKELKKII